MGEPKEFWITNNRFKYIGLILLIMFLSFMFFLYMKADEITKDPCSICAEYMGEKVVCTTQDNFVPVNRIYHINGSIEEDRDKIKTIYEPEKVNLSKYFDQFKNGT